MRYQVLTTTSMKSSGIFNVIALRYIPEDSNFNLSQVSRLGCIDLAPSVGGSLDWPAQRHSKPGVLNVLSLTSTAVILLSVRDTGIKCLLELPRFTHMLKSTI